MLLRIRKKLFLAVIVFLFLSFWCTRSFAIAMKTNTLTGATYTIYLFNTQGGSTSLSFENDLLFTVGAHEGVGVYLPVGTMFAAAYWAPKTQEQQDLFLIFNGLVMGNFILGWGLSLPNYQITNAFLFFGYAGEM
jgi:hypothetical protein